MVDLSKARRPAALVLETERNLDLGSFYATHDNVNDYLASVGDATPIYQETGLAPPLYSSASALGFLLRELALPHGAIHSLQEVETVKPVAIGSEVKVTAFVEKPRRRAGLEFITVTCTMKSDGDVALISKSTVLVPPKDVSGTVAAEPKAADSASISSELAVISKEISQEQLHAYARVSGDDNPLHLDAEFAAKTQFGGVIAHGMLTLAFVSEMMAQSHGRVWLESAGLSVRFKGAAHLGAKVSAWGNFSKNQDSVRSYSVGVQNAVNGQELIAGTASFNMDES